MAKVLSFPRRLSFTDADTGKRVRLAALTPGAALQPAPQPILGGCYHRGHLTVYVAGSMPLSLRSAQEEGRLDQEAWLVDELPPGIQEIDLTDCRREFRLRRAA